MFKYLVLFAVVFAVAMAAPPAPKDLDTASQLLYSAGYGGYAAYPAYSGYAAAYPGYGYAYYGR